MDRGSCLDKIRKEEEEEVAPLPGLRFYPTDEELLGFYLRRKVEGKPLPIDQLIKQIDIYKYDPWDLPKVDGVDDREWYFFCMRGRKYKNSVRPNRVRGSGFWKATGIDKPIYSTKDSRECIGLKKSLVYYRGKASKGTKTNWMMHEFRLPPKGKIGHSRSKRLDIDEEEAEVWTLCRIFRRTQTPSKRYIPEWKDKKPDAKKQTIISTRMDFSPKSCSFVPDYGEHFLNFSETASDRELVSDEQQYYWSGKYSAWEHNMNFWYVDGDQDQDFLADRDCDGLEISCGTSGTHQFVSSLWF